MKSHTYNTYIFQEACYFHSDTVQLFFFKKAIELVRMSHECNGIGHEFLNKRKFFNSFFSIKISEMGKFGNFEKPMRGVLSTSQNVSLCLNLDQVRLIFV